MTTDELERLKEIMQAAGFIKFEIQGCGCCGSPSVDIVHSSGLNIEENDFKYDIAKPTKKMKIKRRSLEGNK